jgi:hypothetical protein
MFLNSVKWPNFAGIVAISHISKKEEKTLHQRCAAPTFRHTSIGFSSQLGVKLRKLSPAAK